MEEAPALLCSALTVAADTQRDALLMMQLWEHHLPQPAGLRGIPVECHIVNLVWASPVVWYAHIYLKLALN